MVVEKVLPPTAAPGEGAAPGAGRGRLVLAALAAITILGAALRVLVARQSIFADELSTFWISARHGLGEVLNLLYSHGRIHHAEITPPVSFLASWLSTRPGDSPELLRLPALVAGTATIPLVHLIGRRTVGRGAGLVAGSLVALSPFMIYYSAEARAYGLMMFLLAASTLSMLLALDTGRNRYWVLYAVCAAAAFCTHYTSAFILAVQLLWLLWAEPRARRAGLLASLGAAVLVLPWLPGLIADLRSPTVKILSALSPFTGGAVRVDIEHWALGYPYTVAGGLRELPGIPALALLAAAGLLVAGGLILRGSRRGLGAPDRRLVLLGALLLATPVGEIVISATGNHIIGVRDLAASWPFLALTAAGLLAAAPRGPALAAALLAVVAFALGAAKMLESRFARPDYQAAAAYVAAHAGPRDVVLDGTGGLSPGPLTGFDVAFARRLRVIRALAPAERDHPFTVFDPVIPIQTAFSRAIASASGARIYVVSAQVPVPPGTPTLTPGRLPGGYVRVGQASFAGFQRTLVTVYGHAARGR